MDEPKKNPLGGGRPNQQQDLTNEAQPPAPAKAAKPAAKVAANEGWFIVKKGGVVSRQHGQMKLPEGEVIHSSSYDPAKLRQAGIQLEACEAPEWHTAAQG